MDTEEMMRRKIRKHRNTLYILGTGTITLGIWNAVKIIIAIINTPLLLFQGAEMRYEPDSSDAMMYALLLLAITGISMLIYIFTGDRARAEGLGERKGPLYIVVTFLLALVHAASVAIYAGYLFSGNIGGESLASIIVTMTVDLTVTVAMIELGCSAVMIRVYERRTIAGSN